jgi:hypothetical protein
MEKKTSAKALLSIGEVSTIFGIHQDTLRNWDKKGILVPLKIGPRAIGNTVLRILSALPMIKV